MIVGNTADENGGAADYSRMWNCTVVSNRATRGGGASDCDIWNSIVYYNLSTWEDDNYDRNATFNHSCTTPLPPGNGNTADEPGIAALDNPHLVAGSRCINAGNNLFVDILTDIDGEQRIHGAAVDIGCDEFIQGAVTGSLGVTVLVDFTNAVVGTPLQFEALIGGRPTAFEWRWGDGETTGARPLASHAYRQPGSYDVVVDAWNVDARAAATVTVHVVSGYTNFVSLSGGHIAPFANWATAATNIQAAVDSALAGGVTLVAAGTYDTGDREYRGTRHRIAIGKPLTVRAASSNRASTILVGRGPLGDGAVRCAYLADGAVLTGFTVTNGHTRRGPDPLFDGSGGGVFAEEGGLVSNCTVIGNVAFGWGGGIYGGHVQDSLITGNSANGGGGTGGAELRDCQVTSNYASSDGGGTWGGALLQCVITGNTSSQKGGGAFGSAMRACTVKSNSAFDGGGAYQGSLSECLVESNSATNDGGGTYRSTAELCTYTDNTALDGGGMYEGTASNCLLAANFATRDGGGSLGTDLRSCTVAGNFVQYGDGGGCSGGEMLNSVVYQNTAAVGSNNHSGCTLDYSCTSPHPGGTNNVPGPPRFVNAAGGDYRLQAGSPCVDAGRNDVGMQEAVDLDGNPRVMNEVTDMGAYETPFTAELRVLLQGAYEPQQGMMAADLVGQIPLVSPYAADIREVEATPVDTVDWVLIELVDSNDIVVVSRSAHVVRTGAVVDEHGRQAITVEVSPGEELDLVVRHRNHLDAVSAAPLVFTNTLMTYDFVPDPATHLGGTNACVELAPGVWGMIAGDCDGDGKITEVDREIVRQQAGKTGYLPGDCDLDGVVTEADVP